MAAQDEVNIRFGADIAALNASIAKMEQGIKDATKNAAEQAKANLGGIEDALASMAKKAAILAAGLLSVDAIKDATLLAARYETLGVSMTMVGNNAGYTNQQMNDAASAMQKTGISMIESRQQAMRLVQSNIDLAESTKLARIAQDAAVIGNMNSSEAFANMIHGIQTGQTDVLRTVGLNVNLEQSYKKYADSIHTTSANLTAQQKIQATVNAVKEEGVKIEGTYVAAMNTAGKQINSIARYHQDLKVAIGGVFTAALADSVHQYNVMLKEVMDKVTQLANDGTLAKLAGDVANVFGAVSDVVVTSLRLIWSVVSDVFSAIGNIIQSVFGTDGSALKPLELFGNMLKVVGILVVGFRVAVELAFALIVHSLVSMVGYIVAAGSAMGKFFSGDFMDISGAWEKGLKDREMALDESTKHMVAIAEKGAKDIEKIAIGSARGPVTAADNPKAKTNAQSGGDKPNAKSEMGTMEEELNQLRLKTIKDKSRELDKEEEQAYWQNILMTRKLSANDQLAVQRKLSADELAIVREKMAAGYAETKKQAEDIQAITELERATKEKADMDGIEAKRAAISQARAMRDINAQEELAALRNLEIEKAKLIRDAAVLRQADYAQDAIEYKKLQAEIEAQKRASDAKIKEIDNKAIVERRAEWDAMMKPVTDALDKSVNGVIAGTTTIKKAFSDLANSIMLEITNKIIKQGIEKMMDSMFKSGLAGGASGGGKSGGGGIGASILGSLVQGSFATGAWNLPNDMVAQVHKGETILPASQAEKFRNGQLGGGSNMSVSNNFVISGPIDRSTQDQIAMQAALSLGTAQRRNG